MDERLDERLRTIFEGRIPFNRLLDLSVDVLAADRVALSFRMRPELVGNFIRGSLHGGVISSTLDVAGSLAAFVEVARSLDPADDEGLRSRLAGLGTIDLRVDFLRPGLGSEFTATAYIQRAGNRVAVTRMELHNEARELIAVGTGAYIVG